MDRLVQALLRMLGGRQTAAGLREDALGAAIEFAGARQGSLYLDRGQGLHCVLALDAEGTPLDAPPGPLQFSAARRSLDATAPLAIPVAQAEGAVTVVCLPLFRDGALHGVLQLDQGPAARGFGERERELLEKLAQGVGQALERAEADERLRRELARLVSRDPRMQRVFGRIERIAGSGDAAPLLIRGEPGTGKELAARALHLCSPRADGPFVVGGALEAARGGTLFIEQLAAVAELLPSCREHDVWLIGAAIDHSEPCEPFAETLDLPPLRERIEDLPLLVAECCAPDDPPVFEAEALRLLERYAWPGNLRELRQTVDRLRLVARGRSVTPLDLPDRIAGRAAPAEARSLEQIKAAGVEAAVRAQLAAQSAAGSAPRVNKSALAETLGVTRKTVQSLLRRYQIDLARLVREAGGA